MSRCLRSQFRCLCFCVCHELKHKESPPRGKGGDGPRHPTSPGASRSYAHAPWVCLSAKHLHPGQSAVGQHYPLYRDTEDRGPFPRWKPVRVGRAVNHCEHQGKMPVRPQALSSGKWSVDAETLLW